MADVRTLGQAGVLRRGLADVAHIREHNRQRKMQRSLLFFGPLAAWLWWRQLTGDPVGLGWPTVSEGLAVMLPQIMIVVFFGVILLLPLMLAGKSPHVRFRPSEIETSFDDVRGMPVVLEEVVRTLNLFLGFKTFREAMGGTPRRGILFEGPPGTGKTYMAKALAKEAGVPFFYVSSSAFQSMYYGQTNRKIRSFFKELRKAAALEGGAVGFIEEIDAIAGARSGMNATPLADDGGFAATAVHRSSPAREGISGIVNELLVQLQSFDHPTRAQRLHGWMVDRVNVWLPDERQLAKKRPTSSNVLIIGATNRAADLDPALLRPGRFDRSVHFDLPNRSGRREIIDYYLDRKAHDSELDRDDRRDALAAMTAGYSPVMIEHLFDEGLVWALREDREAMTWHDVQQAKMTEEIGLKQPVEYTDDDKRRIATHEAGHAVVAHLLAPTRKLEVLSIIKRRDALGLLAHSDGEERFTRTAAEMRSFIEIAFGGMVAEEQHFGQASTGPAGDLAYATRVAAQMVGSYGMAGTLVSFEAVEAGLGAQGIVGKVLGNDAARKSVEAMLQAAKERVRILLDENRHLLEGLVDALLERDELVGEDITSVLEAAAANAPARRSSGRTTTVQRVGF
ncbi:MAG TPA: AAA family ATPase [Acidimicrobiia bacterium]|nr:AAA family ATPase [Acidimicrobiia bacterium]